MVVGQVVGDVLDTYFVSEVLIAVTAAIITWYVRKVYHEKKAKEDRVRKMHEALFGVDDVQTMDGVVEIIEAHEQDISMIFDKLDEAKSKRQELDEKIQKLREDIENRQSGSELGED